MGARRKARICALQMLFQYDISRPSVDELIRMYWDEFGDEAGDVAQDFSNNLAVGAITHLEEIDALIKKRAENWRINRMAVVDRNILRMAIYEYATQTTLSESIIIAEAIDLAKLFGAESTARFVNGVLGALASDDQDEVRRILSPESED